MEKSGPAGTRLRCWFRCWSPVAALVPTNQGVCQKSPRAQTAADYFSSQGKPQLAKRVQPSGQTKCRDRSGPHVPPLCRHGRVPGDRAVPWETEPRVCTWSPVVPLPGPQGLQIQTPASVLPSAAVILKFLTIFEQGVCVSTLHRALDMRWCVPPAYSRHHLHLRERSNLHRLASPLCRRVRVEGLRNRAARGQCPRPTAADTQLQAGQPAGGRGLVCPGDSLGSLRTSQWAPHRDFCVSKQDVRLAHTNFISLPLLPRM